MTDALDVESFLQAFFGPGNAIKLSDIRSGRLAEAQASYLRLWLPDLEKDELTPVVLPRKMDDSGDTVWYALAFNEQQLRSLRNELHAAVGATYTDFAGQDPDLELADAVETAALAFVGPQGGIFRFSVPDGGHRGEVRRSLERLRQLWGRRPTRTEDVPRPTGRILRDFHQALNAHDGDEADAYLMELKAKGRLSTVNLLFLRVERYARLREWEQLLRLEDLPRLVGTRRPPRVSDALANAYYSERLASIEDNPSELLEAFRSGSLPVLFDDAAQAFTPTAERYWAIGAIASGRPDLASKWLSSSPNDQQTTTLVEALLAEATPATEAQDPAPERLPDPIEEAVRLRMKGQHQAALDALTNVPVTRVTVELAIEWANTLNTLVAAAAVEEMLRQLDSASVEELMRHPVFGILLAQILRLSEEDGAPETVLGSVPGDWIEFFDRLAQDGTWPGAISVARDGALEWDPGVLANDPSLCKQLSTALDRARSTDPDTLRESLPHLLAFLDRIDEPSTRFAELYEHLLIELVTGTVTRSDLETTRGVVEVLLQISGDTGEYLGYVVELWRHQGTANHLWFMADIVDLLAQHATAEIELRRRALRETLATALQSPSNVDEGLWGLLRFLADEVELAQEVDALKPGDLNRPSDAGTDEIGGFLAGKSIALYSLTESAITRAKTILESEYPHCSVSVNSDHGGTDRLKAMAENADIFVMVTWSATHAATQFIESHRGSRQILRPKGRGSSSILAEIRKSTMG
jgi:hypothetical protein